MEEFWKSCAESIKRRASTAMLGTYAFFWAAFHWQGFYVTFFVSEENIAKTQHMLKNEYVSKYFFGYEGWHFYLGLVIPAALTYVFIWVLPDLLFIRAFRKERAYKLSKQKEIIKYEINLEKHRASLATQSKKTLVEEKKAAKEEQALAKLDPTVIWQREFDEFTKHSQFQNFNKIIESTYTHAGKIRDEYNSLLDQYQFGIPRDLLVYADVNGLVTLSDKKDKIELTEKGKYFVRLYSQIKG